MKALSSLLAVSLAANLAGAWWLFGRAQGRPTASTLPAAVAAGIPGHAPASPAPATAAAADYRVLHDRLLAAGFPPEVVQAAIRGALQEPRLARQRQFTAGAASQPWWQGGLVYQDITPEQTRELRELLQAQRAEIERVLGPSAFYTEGERERFDFLPADKAEQLARLERNHQQRRRDVPTDRGDRQARLRELDAEHAGAVAALLTREEQAQLEERDSTTAQTIASRFEFFAGTEEEYRRVFALQKAYADRYTPSGGTVTPVPPQARVQAMQQLARDIEASFTPERYAAFLQSQRPEYRALVELQRRHPVPQAAFDQVARLHAEVGAEGLRIADGAALSREQKHAALTALSSRARQGVQAALGAELGATFIGATRSSWLDPLERGNIFVTQPTGGYGTRHVGGAAPAPPAGATGK